VRDFWKDELKAGEWVMDVLQNGYVIPFAKIPPVYEEQNNASATQDMSFVLQAVEDLRRLGVIKFLDEKPHCVSPLSVSRKTGSDGAIKKRLCFDASRCVNRCIAEQSVTLSHFQRALEMTREGDFQVIYDLKAFYHHVRIHPSHMKYLGAAIPGSDGNRQYFVFCFLPFGLSSAVHCVTKLFKPVGAFIHEKGIRHSIYIDDGRILAETEDKAEENRVVVYDVLKRSGFIIEFQKSDKKGEASHSKNYLGFIIDTVSMTVRLNEAKRKRIMQQVLDTIAYGSRPISAKELAATLGKMVATEPALGPMVLMAARAGYASLEEATQTRGWSSNLIMSKETLDGLKFFAENCSIFDNTPIRSAATEISVLSIIGPPSSFITKGFVANHVRTDDERIWASDASEYATCAYSVKGEHLYYRGILTEEERALSSGHRELLAVTRTLEFYEHTGTMTGRPTNIYWLTDSQNLATFLMKGSGRSHIQKEVFKIMVLCKKLNIRIIPIHLLRDDPRIKVADDGSKMTDTDDWQVDIDTYQTSNRNYGFTVDLFASSHNAKCEKYYSNFYCAGTSGIDAFSHQWDDEIAWICPPIKEVVRTIRKLKTSKVAGVLLVPEWKTADYWVEIFDSKGSLLWPFTCSEICRPFIIQRVHDFRSPFSGRAKFNFLKIGFSTYK